jgi:putative redox protein
MGNLLAAIASRQSDISGVRLEVTGQLDGSPARFAAVSVCVFAESAAPEALEKLVDVADRGCIMMNTLRETLDLSVRIGVPV